MHTFARTAALAATLALFAGPAMAEQLHYTAALTAAEETPPADSTGSGAVDAVYDTEAKSLSWTVTYDELSGPVTAAHFHGPAKPGEKAAPVVPLTAPFDSPISGSAMLTDEQLQQLKDGLWYFNLHTAKFPDGEIRGQVLEANVAN